MNDSKTDLRIYLFMNILVIDYNSSVRSEKIKNHRSVLRQFLLISSSIEFQLISDEILTQYGKLNKEIHHCERTSTSSSVL